MSSLNIGNIGLGTGMFLDGTNTWANGDCPLGKFFSIHMITVSLRESQSQFYITSSKIILLKLQPPQTGASELMYQFIGAHIIAWDV